MAMRTRLATATTLLLVALALSQLHSAAQGATYYYQQYPSAYPSYYYPSYSPSYSSSQYNYYDPSSGTYYTYDPVSGTYRTNSGSVYVPGYGYVSADPSSYPYYYQQYQYNPYYSYYPFGAKGSKSK